MAVKHKVPIVPIYCFGSSMLMKRLKLPNFIEKLGLMLRISLVVFFGKWGLPIPFRQRLLYVMGKPIYPPITTGKDIILSTTDQRVEHMYQQYCQELIRHVIF